MQYGVCGDHVMAGAARQAGFTYVECNVAGLLKPREDRASFLAALAQARSGGLPIEVCNGFIPGDLKIAGPAANMPALETYVTTAFQRAREAGVEIIVFGSGRARQIPEGFDLAQGRAQVAAFCRMLAPVAGQYGVTVVVEPLNRMECNVLNSVGECAALVREVDHPALRLLVDAYHLMKDHDSYGDIAANGDILAHVHIATLHQRLAPGAEPCDFEPFFEALAKAGYNGRISIEARIPDPPAALPRALALMKQLEEAARKITRRPA